MNLEWLKFNKLAGIFAKNAIKEDLEEEEVFEKNSQGVSDEEYAAFMQASKMGGFPSIDNVFVTSIDFSMLYESKINRVAKYREMSKYPEIGDALEYIIDDAIVEDDEGKILNLQFLKKVPRAIEKQMMEIWDQTIENVFNFRENGRNLFKRWLIDGELYLEPILSRNKKDIQSIKILPSFTMAPIYKNGMIAAFKQTLQRFNMPITHGNTKSNEIDFEKNQVLYTNYGDFGENLLDTHGYLEKSIRLYNQLKSLEDALIVYRLVRAPERRVWNIAVGKMPKGKAEEYIRGLINRYKKRQIYDPATGKVDSTQNIQSLTEDYWFPQTDSGQKTSVETIGGNGALIGELEDVKLFIKKLYLALQIPRSRWDENYVSSSPYSIGRVGEVTREEIKFSHFIEGLQRRFKTVILDCFRLKCKMNGIEEKWYAKNMVDITFTESNLFKEFKQIEIEQTRYNMFSTAYNYVRSQMNPDGFLAKEFAIRKYLKFTDEEMKENEKLLKEQIDKEKEEGIEFNQNQFGGNQFDYNNNYDQGNPVDRFNQISNDIDNENNLNTNEQIQKEDNIQSKKKLITASYYEYAKLI